MALGVLGGHVPQSKATFSEHGFLWLMQIMMIIHKLYRIALLIPFFFFGGEVSFICHYEKIKTWLRAWGADEGISVPSAESFFKFRVSGINPAHP